MVVENNVIDRAFDVFCEVQRRQGLSVDELSFVGGFQACYGIITGRVSIGLPPGTTVGEIIEAVQGELERMRADVFRKQAEQNLKGA
jgi:hypothetical protein